MNITKDDVADDTLCEYENLDQADLFFSHSHLDYKHVISIAQQLYAKGVYPWLAETHIQQHDHINLSIISALKASQALILFLSSNFLESKWSGKELSDAQKQNKPIYVIANIDCNYVEKKIKHLVYPKTNQNGKDRFDHLLEELNILNEQRIFVYSAESKKDYYNFPSANELYTILKKI